MPGGSTVVAVDIRPATDDDVAALALLAAETFPLAAPPDTAPESIAEFLAEHLSQERFAAHLADRSRDVLVAADGTLVGYVMLVDAEPLDADVLAAVTTRPTIELSKFYVSPAAHGQGLASQLMQATFAAAEDRGAASIWLGVNEQNERAQRFYAKHGFEQVGTKRFRVGARLEHDHVLERPLRHH